MATKHITSFLHSLLNSKPFFVDSRKLSSRLLNSFNLEKIKSFQAAYFAENHFWWNDLCYQSNILIVFTNLMIDARPLCHQRGLCLLGRRIRFRSNRFDRCPNSTWATELVEFQCGQSTHQIQHLLVFHAGVCTIKFYGENYRQIDGYIWISS